MSRFWQVFPFILNKIQSIKHKRPCSAMLLKNDLVGLYFPIECHILHNPSLALVCYD